jgi:hypothetical protein|uniref:Uncharacterized protein n=1 Tax=Eutreptiella gymnastica TaxID=73025 RepID=A0A7S4FX08_9EUGL|eukprot:CAMPEP_0174316082 /NCGR_PEP_ID=MMETSP0810-20121108/6695_1 /TAXON_ID=73025 ORGANISM="Eutreptiella gymnastica-like, Strain CCMP1594" /NCGR_SAMPLE_ID=MMETSP0810 /ASSEMBLY_ACC=CAM_ASM_000659 /LENGTH=130 /DNA_ID=CAMNT_0015425641 /DNA_START=740 /DNA_END=1132 /DNA_ORIENTATION=+
MGDPPAYVQPRPLHHTSASEGVGINEKGILWGAFGALSPRHISLLPGTKVQASAKAQVWATMRSYHPPDACDAPAQRPVPMQQTRGTKKVMIQHEPEGKRGGSKLVYGCHLGRAASHTFDCMLWRRASGL